MYSLKKESATNIATGLTFSPDGKHAYVADTGIDSGFFGLNFTRPASVYVLSFLMFPSSLEADYRLRFIATDLM